MRIKDEALWNSSAYLPPQMADEPLILSDPLSILIPIHLGTLHDEFLSSSLQRNSSPKLNSPPRCGRRT